VAQRQSTESAFPSGSIGGDEASAAYSGGARTLGRRDALAVLGLGAVLLACKGGKAELVDSSDGVTQLMKPKGWSVAKDLNAEATIQISELLPQRFAIVLSESKVDLAIKSLQEYSDITRGAMRTTTTSYAEAERTDLIINGMTAIRYRVDATVSATRVVYLHTVVEGKAHYHQLLAWTTASKFTSNRAELEAVINSFREK